MIEVASCQRLNISKSETSRLQKPIHIIKVASCHQLMSQLWKLFTQSTSEDIISESGTPRFRNPKYIIKVGSYHQLVPRTCKIFTTKFRGHSCSIVRILRKSHLPHSYSRDFENPNKNLSWTFLKKCDKMLSDPIQRRIIYFYISLFSYVPGLFFFLSYVVIIH